MTISYRMSMTDNWHQIRCIFTKTILGKCLLVFFLVIPFVAPVVFYHVASSHPALPSHHAAPSPRFDHLAAITSLIVVSAFYAIILFGGLIGLYLATLILPRTTITVEPEFLTLSILTTEKLRWKQFSAVAEEADHFYFVGWKRAFLVPKRAFNSSAEAESFFDTALVYWRKATGIVPPPAPNVSGVWPPAPRAGDSQELGGTPKG